MRTQVGQLFVISYKGESPPRLFLEFLREEQIAGVILFADNCPTHEVARDAIRQIREYASGECPLIAVDQEGGRVCRLRGVPAEYHAASWYADQPRGLELFTEEYGRSSLYLAQLGFNLNFAPVCDLFLDPTNVCLKDRCFGSQPSRAAEFVARSVELSHRAGLLSCLKHFPGLGAASIDPHVGTSEAAFDIEQFHVREAVPFRAGIAAGANLVMTTHLLNPLLDSVIATGSKVVTEILLRGRLGFDGPIVTDDLFMGGTDVLGDVSERTVSAFRAGHDLLLFGQNFDAAAESFDNFRAAVERGDIPRQEIDRAIRRVAGLKFSLRHSLLS